ncbi:hypothetical protein DPMN_140511 [Dreissena polymorpha]|uniref:Uncharacterized protein n=1 Tax=Dreissena polymorpha TaxID=45954 RepID=A0A9D4JHG6_DREPO|nr:hypothetical protein DPMN_140511 [Dreissena polymorpha]
MDLADGMRLLKTNATGDLMCTLDWGWERRGSASLPTTGAHEKGLISATGFCLSLFMR